MENATDYFEILARHARMQGDRIAVYSDGQQITYAQLSENIDRFGNMLRALGVRPGERVVLAFPDGPDSYYAFFGAMKCGAIPALISPDLALQDYGHILRDSGAGTLITVRGSEAATAEAPELQRTLLIDDDSYPSLLAGAAAELAPHPRAPEEISFIQYTSGSTGDPKGVSHSQRGMLFCARRFAGEILNMSSGDICFSVSKLFFGYGFGNSVIFPLYYGASTVLFSGKPGPADVFQVIDRYRPTLLFSVPTFYNILLKSIPGPLSLPSLRLCVSAGEALPAGTYRSWQELTGLEIIDGLGSTEALHIFIANRPGRVRPGTSGYVVSGYEAKLVGEDGRAVEAGQQGLLHVRGGSTSPGYWNQPGKSAQTMLPGGWVNTGDYYVEEDGCYTYQGRQDDLFKAAGAWVSPIKVEAVLRSHPAVMECAVTSRKLEGLVKPMAYVVLNPGFTGDMKLMRELRAHVLQRLPDHMCPVQFNYVQEIPKTRTGKVQRYALKE